MRIDFHTHVVPPLPDHARRYGDARWPEFLVDGDRGRLVRDGVVVRTVPSSSWSPAARLEDMDAVGVDRQVLSPLPPVICDWADPEPAREWCVALNDGIAAMVAGRPDRFAGLGTVPLQHPEQALAVLERARAAGLRGVEIGTTGGDRELDHPALRPFFAAAAEWGMVVFVHPLLLGTTVPWTPRISGAELTFGLGMVTDTAIAASRLVLGGVTEELPALRICLAHGGGTFAWMLPRIAKAWDGGHARTVAELAAGVHVDSVVYAQANLTHLCAVLGADRVVFGTDYPLPAQDDLAGGVLAGLAPGDREQVESGTAERLLRPPAPVPGSRGPDTGSGSRTVR